ncbi:cell division cycle and apoptosis regulator protein 1-like isoform X2 [Schistocerca cancellata]|nr:cell division cycle and apoptosis regulator protein 1-like isoform X2 [Schistocerca cancellata]XP_049786968.1 cell division cycle and apoptosis regulator protein 1-like isoform X2 [Schistocerca cancellata]
MSQFGQTTKNPPWVRTTAQTLATGVGQQQQQQMQTQMIGQNTMGTLGTPTMVQYQQQQQPVFQTPIGMQQPGMAMTTMPTGMATAGVAMQTALGNTQMFPQVATVSYPTPRSLNPTAFQSAPVTAVPPVPPANPNPSPKQRVFTGTVTKVHDNFGFIDEDVFFQTSCCVKGSNPVVGDRVLVEASYNPNMPFKWNATRIQVLPMSTANTTQRPQNKQGFTTAPSQNTYNAVPPPAENSGSGNNYGNRSNQRKSSRQDRKDRARETDDEEVDRKKRREERIREREEKEKRSPSVRQRSKSPRPRRRQRIVPRYMVHIPKMALDLPEADVLELRRRYSNMYVPSDFFSANFRWVDAFPPNTPFTLDRPCSFHVMHKEVDAVLDNKAVLEPPDADYLFSAKVMLMSMPLMEEVYRKCCQLAEEKDKDSDDGRDFVHPTRLINFLVGLRGKNETMAVGGPWSPSLDGPNPDKDPAVLIRTAIRTCQALTGVNLSSCTQWYRFLEIYYRRGETTHKGRTVAARVETVVLFLPDVWSCVPTRLEWDGLHLNYKKQLERKQKADQDAANGATGDEKEVGEETQDVKREPTHFSELDPKTMKVSELRQELEARTLSPKGLKSQLIARLTKAIKTEAEKAEELEEEKKKAEPEPPKQDSDSREDEKRNREEEDRKKQDEREKLAREKRYTLPDGPHILVHPSRTAKSGKFDCTVMSLSVLLDYRPEDTKEHSFEVSLFAELFNEMLMRDFGFRIYRALHDAPERPKEEEKDKDKKKDKKDDRKSDKKNGKREERDEKKEDRHSKDKSRNDKERNEEKDEDDEEDDDEDDDDLKDDRRDKDKDDKDRKRDKDKKKKDKVKLYTEDPLLLLAFLYFDQSHCGYIFDKDIEELLYTLGLNLSRAQVRKLVQKVVTRDSLHYRKLTDKPISKQEEGKEKEHDRQKEELASVPSSENLIALAYGNKRFLPVFTHFGSAGSPPSKRARRDIADEGKESSSTPEGFIMYKGCLLDIEKLMQQLQRSEKARLDTENKMMNIKRDLGVMKEHTKVLTSTAKELTQELHDYRSKLAETEEELTNVKAKSDVFYSALKDVQIRIAPVIASENAAENSGARLSIGNKTLEKSKACASTPEDDDDDERKLQQVLKDEEKPVTCLTVQSDLTSNSVESDIPDEATVKLECHSETEVCIYLDDEITELNGSESVKQEQETVSETAESTLNLETVSETAESTLNLETDSAEKAEDSENSTAACIQSSEKESVTTTQSPESEEVESSSQIAESKLEAEEISEATRVDEDTQAGEQSEIDDRAKSETTVGESAPCEQMETVENTENETSETSGSTVPMECD